MAPMKLRRAKASQRFYAARYSAIVLFASIAWLLLAGSLLIHGRQTWLFHKGSIRNSLFVVLFPLFLWAIMPKRPKAPIQ
jgi:hypothetical protein